MSEQEIKDSKDYLTEWFGILRKNRGIDRAYIWARMVTGIRFI